MQVVSEEAGESESLVRLRLITHNARLVDARKERGMTQPEMAQAAGVPCWRLQHIENLKILPTEDDMIKMACVLEKPIDYLFPEELLAAIKVGVFSRRKAELAGPQILSLAEARCSQLTYDGETLLIEEANRTLLPAQIEKVLNTLLPREKRVLELRFGLKDGQSRTHEEVGKEFAVTRERIRQIEVKALRRLRHPSRSRMLKDYLD